MFRLDEQLKVYLHREPIDFRLNINGLALRVEQALGLNPFAACVYVFSNRRRDRVKILGWDRNGFWLLLKRLEKDRFIWPSEEAVPILERAALLDPQSAEVGNNLELARALIGQYDERRRRGESARAWSRRLNNQGYAALLAGDREAARRLLSKAITASPSRFEAAERNLARANAE